MQKINQNNFENIIKEMSILDMHFYKIDFSWMKLSWKNFINCKFEKCNLSNVIINDTTLNNVDFIKSKIMWIKFNKIKQILSNFNFFDCNIILCDFKSLKMTNTIFRDSKIFESDFYYTNLEWADFSFCEMQNTIFEKTILKKACFLWSSWFFIDPNKNNLIKAKFSRDNAIELLNSLDIIIE